MIAAARRCAPSRQSWLLRNHLRATERPRQHLWSNMWPVNWRRMCGSMANSHAVSVTTQRSSPAVQSWDGRMTTAGTGTTSLRAVNEQLNNAQFDSLDDTRRKLVLWCYDYNSVSPHSSLGTQPTAGAREQFEDSAHDALPKLTMQNMKSGPANSRPERGSLGAEGADQHQRNAA